MIGDGLELHLRSPLTPEICAERLRAGLSHVLAPLPVRSFAGRVIGDAFSVRKAILYRNSMQRYFVGRMTPEGGGTRIDGHFRLSRQNAAAFLSVPVIAAAMVLYAIASNGTGIGWVQGIAAAVFITLILWAAVTIGDRLAQGESEQVARFLIETLEATIVPGT